MLDAIADFWKPMKKNQTPAKIEPELLQVGSSIGFGFVPQANLSGRRLQVDAVNTYQFGEEALTSFVLVQDKNPSVSLIVAEAEGEQYLAISRYIPLTERLKLFDSRDLENILEKPDAVRLTCRDAVPDFRGWVVSSYKREIQGLKGRLFKGDFRKAPLPNGDEGLAFEYTLLVSDSNEHALEIEKYHDGRIEVYATVYRRLNDIGEMTHPGAIDSIRPDIKIASVQEEADGIAMSASSPAPVLASEPQVLDSVKAEPLNLREFAEPAKPELKFGVAPAIPSAAPTPLPYPKQAQEEKPLSLQTTETTLNGSRNDMTSMDTETKPKLFVQNTAPENYLKQEIKTVSHKPNSQFETDAIECDLRVANKIIDEAIRNEMRLTDIVRRIIELPVAYPESVQIPMSLSDEDYALLAIRYGIASSERNAIKRKIIEDLNDFSGSKQAPHAKAA